MALAARESARLKKFQNDRAETVARMEAMLDEAKDGELNAEQAAEYTLLEAELAATDKRIEREEKFLEALWLRVRLPALKQHCPLCCSRRAPL